MFQIVDCLVCTSKYTCWSQKNAIICMSCFFHSFRSKESFSKGASHVAKSQVCVFKNGASVSASARQLNLSMLEYACPDKTSRQISHATNTCLSRQKFCRGLSWEAYFCRYKRCVLSRQTCVCRDKSKLVETKLCVLLRETHVCRNKMFVATKMILAEAPANDLRSLILHYMIRGCTEHRTVQYVDHYDYDYACCSGWTDTRGDQNCIVRMYKTFSHSISILGGGDSSVVRAPDS